MQYQKSNLFVLHFRPIYCNYEVLCNVFSTKVIDLSKADIYLLKSSEIPKKEFEAFLAAQNQYSIYNFSNRYEKIEQIDEIEEKLKKNEELEV